MLSHYQRNKNDAEWLAKRNAQSRQNKALKRNDPDAVAKRALESAWWDEVNSVRSIVARCCWSVFWKREKDKRRYYRDHEKNKARFRVVSLRRYYAIKENNPEKLKAMRERAKARRKKYRQSERYKLLQRQYKKRYYAKPENRAAKAVRCRFDLRWDGVSESFGTTKEGLVKWLESKFEKGMTWDNHGTAWHIDHIIPVAWYRDKGILDECNHYTNLQPMFASDNLAKSAKVPSVHQPELVMFCPVPI